VLKYIILQDRLVKVDAHKYLCL